MDVAVTWLFGNPWLFYLCDDGRHALSCPAEFLQDAEHLSQKDNWYKLSINICLLTGLGVQTSSWPVLLCGRGRWSCYLLVSVVAFFYPVALRSTHFLLAIVFLLGALPGAVRCSWWALYLWPVEDRRVGLFAGGGLVWRFGASVLFLCCQCEILACSMFSLGASSGRILLEFSLRSLFTQSWRVPCCQPLLGDSWCSALPIHSQRLSILCGYTACYILTQSQVHRKLAALQG